MNLERKSLKSKKFQPNLLFFVIIGVLPFAAAFVYALLYSLGIVGVINKGFTLDFWNDVMAEGVFTQSLLYSVAIAATSIVLSISLALWLTIKLRDNFNKKFLSYAIYMPLAVPGVVSAFFTYQLFSKSGYFSRIAYSFGWVKEAREFPDLVNDQYAIGIVLTFITIVTPFFLLLFLQVYKNERIAELKDLAHALGANNKQVTWKVSLPILLNKTWTLIALYFIFMIGAYEVPLILGKESPQMLSVLIIREIKQYDLTKISEGYVVAAVYTMVVSLAAILLFSHKKSVADAY